MALSAFSRVIPITAGMEYVVVGVAGAAVAWPASPIPEDSNVAVLTAAAKRLLFIDFLP
ncbi:hypothetical protein BH10ACT9_BH10ACT9_57390 [soil metagenome]